MLWATNEFGADVRAQSDICEEARTRVLGLGCCRSVRANPCAYEKRGRTLDGPAPCLASRRGRVAAGCVLSTASCVVTVLT